MLYSLKNIIGYTVQATDKPAGKVADFYVDDVTWAIRHVAMADAGGVGIQMASVEPGQIGGLDAAGNKLSVRRTQADIAGGPDVTLDPPVSHHVNRQNDEHLRSIDETVGYKVAAVDGSAGTIEDFLVDASNWQIDIIVVADAKGRKVMVGPGLLDRLDFDTKTAHVELDCGHFAKSPAYDPGNPPKRVDDVALVRREGV
jgi:hypothetical protein